MVPHREVPAPVLLLAVVLLGAGPKPADVEIARGLELFERLDYDRAVVVLGRALTRPNVAHADRLIGLEALAFSYTILEDAVHAEETFHRLLDVAPDHQIDKARSPRLRNAFRYAKASWVEGRNVALALDPTAPEVAGTLSGDPRRLGAVVVISEDGETWSLRCEGTTCRGPKPAARFRVDLRDHAGLVLATAGPFEGTPPPSRVLPWWAWVAIGVAAAGTTALVIGVAQPGDPPPGSLGTLQLP